MMTADASYNQIQNLYSRPDYMTPAEYANSSKQANKGIPGMNGFIVLFILLTRSLIHCRRKKA